MPKDKSEYKQRKGDGKGHPKKKHHVNHAKIPAGDEILKIGKPGSSKSGSEKKSKSSGKNEKKAEKIRVVKIEPELDSKGRVKASSLLTQLRNFSSGELKNDQLVYGLFLLRQLPASRDAVFDIISITMEGIVEKHFRPPTEERLTAVDENNLLLIHECFIGLLDRTGEIWAPILSHWSLQLLGNFSKQFAGRSALQGAPSVNEIINFWMNSPVIRNIFDITSKCLQNANADTFISALLDTSGRHSPHFDWVVAHMGNSYPQLVVSRVLSLGLTNFSASPPDITSLTSVVGILGHLAHSHSPEVEHAFDSMLNNWLLECNPSKDKYTIPFFLQLCSASVSLLDILFKTALPKVKLETLTKVESLVPCWVNLHFGSTERLISLTTHLFLKSNRGPEALLLLLTGVKEWSETLSSSARLLLNNFVVEVSGILYQSEAEDVGGNWACIGALQARPFPFIRFLDDEDAEVGRVAGHFLKLVTLYDGVGGGEAGGAAVGHLLRRSSCPRHLWFFVDFLAAVEVRRPTLFSSAIKSLALRGSPPTSRSSLPHPSDRLLQWKNLLLLIRSEGELPLLAKITKAISKDVLHLAGFLDERSLTFSAAEASILVEILSALNLSRQEPLRFGTRLTLSRYVVDWLFFVLKTGGRQCEKVKDVVHICRVLRSLCFDPSVQNDGLRNLVHRCLEPKARNIFATSTPTSHAFTSEEEDDEFEPQRFTMFTSLLTEIGNGGGAGISRSHAASFHSGILGKTAGIGFKLAVVENPEGKLNIQLFLSALLSVCTAEGEVGPVPRSVEAMRKVALLLVEIVSPDVMFNGLPWPDEEFSKVQVERDLQIRRAFEEHPYLWELLELVAHYAPSLCYCSVLLRALMATLMAQWTSLQQGRASDSEATLQATVRLVDIMRIGLLLPPPLSYVGEVVGALRAHEVLLLLKDIWNYMKVNIPVPTAFHIEESNGLFVRSEEFLKVDPAFKENLRILILTHVACLGHLYPKLFPPLDDQLTIEISISKDVDLKKEEKRPRRQTEPILRMTKKTKKSSSLHGSPQKRTRKM